MLKPDEASWSNTVNEEQSRLYREVPHHVFGQIALNAGLLRAYQQLDTAFLKLAADLKAQEYQFSSFIKAEYLRKLDYLHSFPQHATFPQVLCCDDHNYHQFRKGEIVSSNDRINVTEMDLPEAILTPAACYHFYIHFQNSAFTRSQVFTTKNTCYRNETEYTPLERQWSFSMREIVCIGHEVHVKKFVDDMTTRLSALFHKLPFDLEWKVATDPFFNPSNNPKHLMQKLQPSKYEIVFDNRLAIGSSNFHRSYFGETFNITIDNGYVYSACIAFGIERWLAAFMSHFGPNCDNWPMHLMEHI
ncbi:MAG: hypothetical protein H6937_06215 [Burkholderiales bacterium]|nr:hypothetical protein [Burkholderiales bacterium]MDR4517397.1 hypothetical protein [Nitrosomonas sp.]